MDKHVRYTAIEPMIDCVQFPLHLTQRSDKCLNFYLPFLNTKYTEHTGNCHAICIYNKTQTKVQTQKLLNNFCVPT